MPELPDVQVFKEYLDATSLHQEIEAVHLRDAQEILEVSPATLRRRLPGCSFCSARRHGKHLFLELEKDQEKAGWLRMHFGMTGGVRYVQSESQEDPGPVKLRVEFQDGAQMMYLNTRKLGSLGLVEDVDDFIEEEGLGPDALSLSSDDLDRLLEGRRGTLKGFLMNQDVLAGIGNVYADEILFQMGIHPTRRVEDVSKDLVDRLHGTMGEVLRKAIDGRVEEFPSNFLIPRRQEGAECPRCGGRIRKTEVSGRPTYFCETHQEQETA